MPSSAPPAKQNPVHSSRHHLALLQCSKIGWCNAARKPISPARNKSRRIAVKKTSLSLAAATSSFAAELPTYEAPGLPISPVQASVVGAAGVEQTQVAPSAVSPLQI